VIVMVIATFACHGVEIAKLLSVGNALGQA
jgi:hypothetical protein